MQPRPRRSAPQPGPGGLGRAGGGAVSSGGCRQRRRAAAGEAPSGAGEPCRPGSRARSGCGRACSTPRHRL